MKVVIPEKTFIDEVWAFVRGSQSLWGQLEGSSYAQFYTSCINSDLLIDLGFGLGRITHLRPGHSCRVHGVFWSKDVYRKISEVAIALMNTAEGMHLRRIECVVPSSSRSLRRYLRRLGFKFEGTMRSFYKGKNCFFDGDLYAILF